MGASTPSVTGKIQPQNVGLAQVGKCTRRLQGQVKDRHSGNNGCQCRLDLLALRLAGFPEKAQGKMQVVGGRPAKGIAARLLVQQPLQTALAFEYALLDIRLATQWR